nr:hypothetical protein [Tanacetum cinerariifolium]
MAYIMVGSNARMIGGKTLEKIRESFYIPDDLTEKSTCYNCILIIHDGGLMVALRIKERKKVLKAASKHLPSAEKDLGLSRWMELLKMLCKH